MFVDQDLSQLQRFRWPAPPRQGPLHPSLFSRSCYWAVPLASECLLVTWSPTFLLTAHLKLRRGTDRVQERRMAVQKQDDLVQATDIATHHLSMVDFRFVNVVLFTPTQTDNKKANTHVLVCFSTSSPERTLSLARTRAFLLKLQPTVVFSLGCSHGISRQRLKPC
ncbi:hypothetical protein LY78DRAFT_112843 [Colletotrichum sublineola]|nr:hypothetical protein LY78DRAFT_112843 [Colletotrichum sublineola]